MKAFLKRILIGIYHIMAKILPVRSKKVIFMSNMGRNYSGNVRAIYECCLNDRRYSEIKKIWVFNGDYLDKINPHTIDRLKESRIVRYGGLRYYFHMATAGVWIFDSRQEPYLVKRKGNLYFMTWHGTPLKKLGLHMSGFNMAGETRNIESYKNAFIEEASKWDYMIVQNDFSESVLPEAFGFKNMVLKTGYPRNDILIREGKTGKETGDKKILLYAPTWRDDEYLGNGFYSFPSRPDFIKLEKELSGQYRIYVKLHYLIKPDSTGIPASCIESGFVKVFGNETDIAELYLMADGLITDYSSVFFDYSVLERPMFFFCYDIEKYRDVLRGFYMDFEKIAPGPVSGNEDELVSDIRQAFETGNADYPKKIKEFKEIYNRYDDGHASERVLEVLAERLGI